MGIGDVFGLAIAMLGLFGIIAVFTSTYKRRLAFKERQLELLASSTAEKAAQYAAHNERLEARVQVLERIATDKSTGLAAEIEDLRKTTVN